MLRATAKRSTRKDILDVSVGLFARHGYEGVTMRKIAAAVGVQAPALYYHFPDKRNLYLAVMAYAVTDKLDSATGALNKDGPPALRLQEFIARLIRDLDADPDLLLLLQRERLDGDEERLKLLVKEVFMTPFVALIGVIKEIAPGRDADALLAALSVIGLVMHPLEARAMVRFIPGWYPEFNQTDRLTHHVCELLREGLIRQAEKTPNPPLV